MMFLLDWNVLSDIARNPGGQAAHRFKASHDKCATSIIVAGEIRYGIAKRPDVRGSIRSGQLLERLPVLPSEPPAERHCGQLRAALERLGTPISANDMLIAAHALALDCTLVTANEREFRRVPGLRVENWLA
jgi:tRNA(fMet)-specific endonuclease VapC